LRAISTLSSAVKLAAREFCGREDHQHPYELFLQLEGIEHKTTKVGRPQSNGLFPTKVRNATQVISWRGAFARAP
jgi:hypothetical protein